MPGTRHSVGVVSRGNISHTMATKGGDADLAAAVAAAEKDAPALVATAKDVSSLLPVLSPPWPASCDGLAKAAEASRPQPSRADAELAGMPLPLLQQEEVVQCPSCKRIILRAIFDKHKATCDTLPMASLLAADAAMAQPQSSNSKSPSKEMLSRPLSAGGSGGSGRPGSGGRSSAPTCGNGNGNGNGAAAGAREGGAAADAGPAGDGGGGDGCGGGESAEPRERHTAARREPLRRAAALRRGGAAAAAIRERRAHPGERLRRAGQREDVPAAAQLQVSLDHAEAAGGRARATV